MEHGAITSRPRCATPPILPNRTHPTDLQKSTNRRALAIATETRWIAKETRLEAPNALLKRLIADQL
jgi:hypothetical protein